MTIFARFDVDGRPCAFWDTSAIDDETIVPDDAVPISPDQQRMMIEYPDRYRYIGGDIAEIGPTIEAQRLAKVAAIDQTKAARFAAGAPFGAQRIAVDDRSRTDMVSMAVAADLAARGVVPWSQGYTDGWICIDNTRLPLPAPADGLALAAHVGDWYARTIQRARDLKDAALAAATVGDLDAIDLPAEWPE